MFGNRKSERTGETPAGPRSQKRSFRAVSTAVAATAAVISVALPAVLLSCWLGAVYGSALFRAIGIVPSGFGNDALLPLLPAAGVVAAVIGGLLAVAVYRRAVAVECALDEEPPNAGNGPPADNARGARPAQGAR